MMISSLNPKLKTKFSCVLVFKQMLNHKNGRLGTVLRMFIDPLPVSDLSDRPEML